MSRIKCWDGLVGYDAALTRLRSWVQFPVLVICPLSFYLMLQTYQYLFAIAFTCIDLGVPVTVNDTTKLYLAFASSYIL